MIWSIPTMWQFPELFLMFFPLTSKIPVILSTYISFVPSFSVMGMVGEAYQVMLTVRGHLITPFILGSMPVGLNILIRHSFTDLWVWIMAKVP